MVLVWFTRTTPLHTVHDHSRFIDDYKPKLWTIKEISKDPAAFEMQIQTLDWNDLN